MNPVRVVLALTLVNLSVLACHLVIRDAVAEESPPMLRGRGLEIVDDQGRLRAQIKIEPADPAYRWPDGSKVGYPETVILRLFSAQRTGGVKLTTSEEGSGLLLSASDPTYVVLSAQGGKTSLKLRNDEKTERVLQP